MYMKAKYSKLHKKWTDNQIVWVYFCFLNKALNLLNEVFSVSLHFNALCF